MLSSSRSTVISPQRRRQSKRTLVVWVWLLGFCLAALIATYMLFVEPPPPRKIVIASGGQNGAYFRYAQKYAEDLKKEGLSVEVRETAGSVENLHLLAENDSGVAVAIVQERGGQQPSSRVAALRCPGQYVSRAVVGLFYRGDKRVNRLAELAGKRVGVGPAGSGTHAIARQLLYVNGLIDSQFSKIGSNAVLVEETVAAAATALQNGSLDAAFFVAAFEARLHSEPPERSGRETTEFRPARGLSPSVSIPGAGDLADRNGQPGPEHPGP